MCIQSTDVVDVVQSKKKKVGRERERKKKMVEISLARGGVAGRGLDP